MDSEQRETNRRNWDERAELHARGKFYDLDGFVAQSARPWLHPSEPVELGSVQGKSLVQLQCHLGLDLLSWLRLGAARGVGLDFSPNAVEHARALAQRCGLDARAQFVVSDVHDAPSAIAAHAPFDIVYVSMGALPWIPMSMLACFTLGFTFAGVIVPAQTLMQKETPHALMGRISSTMMSTVLFAQLLGLALSGVLASAFGVRAVFFLCAALAWILTGAGKWLLGTERHAVAPA